ncbi:MAG: type II toxin-antitoxin system RelE/ParE family toxin [Bacteroidetes bacterium]|nr:type II toxin-antitoxin system RelE/ParE family toxin [Bacteroidota bacterium]MCH8942796.1 type II toxin-antitoxin system RelE/ParE family toxin [Bacteroidota bacterium]
MILKIDELADNPTLNNCIKLTNEEKYRIRMWRYRILYEIIDKKLTVIVLKIGHSKDVYS